MPVDRVTDHVMVSSDLSQHTEWPATLLELDVQKLIIHNVTPKQEQFIEAFGEAVVPELN